METKINYLISLVFITLFSFNTNFLFSQTVNNIEGIWVGDLIINENVKLSMAFEITENEEKSFLAIMHSLDQGAFDINVEEINFDGKNINMTINSLNSIFSGKIETNDSISGGMTQGKNKPWQLCLNKVDKLPIAKPQRPQEPKQPLSYYVEDITFNNEIAGVTIAGTFTRPKKDGKYPVVLLITGSGPNDRDESIFGHKVFLVWADILTNAGIAVLRVDDRGVGESTGSFHEADNRDLADDVVAGVNYLKTRNDIDVKRIGLIGHSLGADIAPIAAVKSNDVKFVVLMAGSAIPLNETIYEQCKIAYPQIGVSEFGVELNHKINVAGFEIVRTESNDSIARIKIAEKMATFNSDVEKLNEKDKKILELSVPLNPKDFYYWLKPNHKFDLFYNPYDDLSKLKCPVLALNGDKDSQVLPQNLKGIEKALIDAGNTNYTIKLFENKNHLFQTCKTGSIEEYGEIKETVDQEVMEFVIDWIKTVKN